MIAAPTASAALRHWIAYAERRFTGAHLSFGHGTHNARDEAVWLHVHVLGIGFEQLDSVTHLPVTALQRRRVLQLIEARIGTRKPLAYLLREAWLAGERFYVDERVIVPRSFIAELLPDGLRPWLPRDGPCRVLDLCTGSGCLAILVAKAFPRARVVASDISDRALAVACRNLALHRLRSRIKLVKSDLLEDVPRTSYDVILSNPPYVNRAAMKRLPAEYRSEPQIALAGGSDGLDSVMRILTEAPRYMAARGLLVMEIGHNRASLERRAPDLAFTWMEISAGDHFVFAVTREQLLGSAEA